jgi:hypothetical protein
MSYLFRAPEFWKNVVALGGAESSRMLGHRLWAGVTRGMYIGDTSYSVRAVPAKVSQLAVFDTVPRS